jgi:hypothetical protein
MTYLRKPGKLLPVQMPYTTKKTAVLLVKSNFINFINSHQEPVSDQACNPLDPH